MKALHQFSAIDSATLLHQLFSDEIPAFLEFVWNLCPVIIEGEARNRAVWDNRDYSFEVLMSQLKQAEDSIVTNSKRLCSDAKFFATELFSGEGALYMRYCLQLYTGVKQHANPKFTQAIHLLFN